MKSTESQGLRLLKQLSLQDKPIFSMADAALASEIEQIPQNQLPKLLSNLTKQGWIFRLRRGLYAAQGLFAQRISIHPFIISAYLVQPSVISHWSALQHHGLTEQIPQMITASTPHKIVTPSMRAQPVQPVYTKHAWEVRGIRYEYMTVQQKHLYGIEKIWLDEHFQVSITDKERTLLDVFIQPKMFGGMGEALGLLENALATIDLKKLIGYAMQYNKKALIKRLGWSLEYFGISSELLEPLQNVSIEYYCRLDLSKPAQGPCDKRWMVQNNLVKGGYQ